MRKLMLLVLCLLLGLVAGLLLRPDDGTQVSISNAAESGAAVSGANHAKPLPRRVDGRRRHRSRHPGAVGRGARGAAAGPRRVARSSGRWRSVTRRRSYWRAPARAAGHPRAPEGSRPPSPPRRLRTVVRSGSAGSASGLASHRSSLTCRREQRPWRAWVPRAGQARATARPARAAQVPPDRGAEQPDDVRTSPGPGIQKPKETATPMHAPPTKPTRSSRRRKLLAGAGVAAAALVAFAGPAGAQEIEAADVQANLDNVFVLLAAVLVIFMQAGFALVEAGLTRAKSVGQHHDEEPDGLLRRGDRLLGVRLRLRLQRRHRRHRQVHRQR